MNELIKVSQLPIIEENLKAMAVAIDEKVNMAKSLVCTENTVKEVKSARSELNGMFKELEEQRKSVKSAVMEPYNRFEAVYKECVTDKFKSADADLKNKISEVEQGLKDEKEREVKEYFEAYKAEKNLDWLEYGRAGINITPSSSNKKLKEQVKDFIDKVGSAVDVIGLQEYPDEIFIEYQKTLDLQYSVRTVIERKEKLKEIQSKEVTEKANVTPLEEAEPYSEDDIILEAIKAVGEEIIEERKITFMIADVPESRAEKIRRLLEEAGVLWTER